MVSSHTSIRSEPMPILEVAAFCLCLASRDALACRTKSSGRCFLDNFMFLRYIKSEPLSCICCIWTLALFYKVASFLSASLSFVSYILLFLLTSIEWYRLPGLKLFPLRWVYILSFCLAYSVDIRVTAPALISLFSFIFEADIVLDLLMRRLLELRWPPMDRLEAR